MFFIKSEFFKDEKKAYWTIFIEYEIILKKTNYDLSGLTEAGNICYEKLREWRKVTAEEKDIPPYVIAKNSHLSGIVRKEIKTIEALKQLSGFGANKVEKYGKDICSIVNAFCSDIYGEK